MHYTMNKLLWKIYQVFEWDDFELWTFETLAQSMTSHPRNLELIWMNFARHLLRLHLFPGNHCRIRSVWSNAASRTSFKQLLLGLPVHLRSPQQVRIGPMPASVSDLAPRCAGLWSCSAIWVRIQLVGLDLENAEAYCCYMAFANILILVWNLCISGD